MANYKYPAPMVKWLRCDPPILSGLDRDPGSNPGRRTYYRSFFIQLLIIFITYKNFPEPLSIYVRYILHAMNEGTDKNKSKIEPYYVQYGKS